MHTLRSHAPHRTNRFNRFSGHLLVVFASFSPLAPVSIAQAAINLGAASLPLRNVLIEVRQVQSGSDQRTQSQASGSLRIESKGEIGVDGRVQAQQRQRQHSDTATQQVLVLNGRSARIALGTRIPMRAVNTFVRNGVLVAVPGSVVFEVGTGFAATPRWNGSDPMELELAAVQSSSTGGGFSRNGANSANGTNGTLPTTQETVSVVSVPLGQWVTVAQSDTDTSGQSTALGGNAQWSGQGSSEVQVRLTLP